MDTNKTNEEQKIRLISDEAYVRQHMDDLKRNIYTTKGARFNAGRRVKRQDTYASFVPFFLSFIVACFSLISLVFSDVINPMQIKIIGSVTVLISIYAIFISLILKNKNYSRKAYSLEQSGKDLTDLHHEITLAEKIDELTIGDLEAFNRANSEIMAKHPDNHSQIDYRYFVVCNPTRYERTLSNMSRLAQNWTRFRYVAHPFFVAIMHLLIPTLITVFGIYFFLQVRN